MVIQLKSKKSMLQTVLIQEWPISTEIYSIKLRGDESFFLFFNISTALTLKISFSNEIWNVKYKHRNVDNSSL